MESNTTPNNRLKIILVITLVLLFGTGFYTLNLYNSNIETQEQLIAEKELVLKDLNNMAAQYDIAIDNNDVANNKLIQARERIEGLMDSLKISDNNVRSLWRYKKKFLDLQDEMKELMLENNTLKEENSMLTNTLDSTKVQLNDRIVYNDSLLNQNTQLATIVRDASVLSAVSLKGLGVIIRSSGKLIPTERASRADELKICYTVPKNKLVTTGEKDFFVQILDPKNNILGENKQINFEEKILNYSLSSKFNYTGKNLDICEFVKPRGKKFEKGRYIVNIFDEAILVSSSQFMLK
ncbi:chromosome partitioning protein ParA [Flavobacteriaceae bacterium]|nr:chromosome partitioning protein ParA [Flavobacteriaceae bacterium]MDC1052122.1 chromosome partitioning protein ParA [Flavobacteriaceae bacterium]MDC3326562.1 chromosome partitioning protein ParA [Flavobacteriaceae bacterium]